MPKKQTPSQSNYEVVMSGYWLMHGHLAIGMMMKIPMYGGEYGWGKVFEHATERGQKVSKLRGARVPAKEMCELFEDGKTRLVREPNWGIPDEVVQSAVKQMTISQPKSKS